MDIITAISPAPAVSLQAAGGDSVGDSEPGAFAVALQQAEISEAGTGAAAPGPLVPAPGAAPAQPLTAAGNDGLTSTVEGAALELQASAAPATEQVIRAAVQAEPEATPAVAAVDESGAESVDDGEVQPLDIKAPAAAPGGSKEQGDVADDDTPQSADSLDAIRQRLDLIDSAGQMASGMLALTPAVAWVQAPAASAEAASGFGVADDPGQATELQWLQSATQPLEAQASEGVDNPAELAPAAEAPSEGVGRVQGDGSVSAPANWEQPSLSGIPASNSSVVGSIVSPASDGAASSITTTLGTDAWQDDLGQQVIGMVRRGEQQVDMQLHPADLGPLSISLSVSEGGIQAQFQSAHASVRAAVEQALPQLQGALAAQGLSLGETSVNDGTSRQAAGEQPRRESSGSGGEARAPRVAQASATVQVPQTTHSGAGVDLYL
ncbi:MULTISPECIES: flagellar hook-length control protein FliK [Pseudomonas]|uniref:flagellar hook-length control protein FliK n=1 Tax=Pseudomonas TaxID=286 RepID=UPI00157436A3|nr:MULTISPECIES: flagellar hook-length control protein FliK [Pseudomonas]MBG6125278.1 flagellar hook-length control protein FliK [Pseudomonas sp. M2]NSX18657.1 flagellar hook-length control protein FliK [Pseudomonas putida]HDS1745532.1 flagellar hook-length control protein FliK [Pseudomonas putida]